MSVPAPGLLPLASFGAGRRACCWEADAATRERLSGRFGLVAIERLAADLQAWRSDGGVAVEGRFRARVVQRCAVSGAPVPAQVDERIAVRFLPDRPVAAGEVELAEEELDILPLPAEGIDLGELVAQSLALALDPYPLADAAVVEEARRQLRRGRSAHDQEGEAASPVSPFAKLKNI